MKVSALRARILPLVLALLLMQGCGPMQKAGDTISVYYLRDISSDSVESAIKVVKYPVGGVVDRATQAMQQLLKNPGIDGLSSPFPKGILIKSLRYDKERVIIGLSAKYGSMYGADLAAADACTVMTLCGIDGISEVAITVNGAQHPMHSRTFLTKEDIIVDDLSLQPVEIELFLYYGDGNRRYIVPELKNIIVRENESAERYVLEELIKGPSEEGLMRIVNENTRLISVSTENRICYVNLSSDFKKGIRESRAVEIQTLCSIANSLCEVEGVEGVQFLVDGDRIYGNTVMRSNPAVVGAYTDTSMDVTTYMNDSEGKYLEAVPSRIIADGESGLEKLIVERLISGIDGSGFLSMLPSGTKLLSINTQNRTCTVNFSKEFNDNDTGRAGRDLMIQSIVLSLTGNVDSLDFVKIKVEGLNYGDGLPIAPNRSYIHP